MSLLLLAPRAGANPLRMKAMMVVMVVVGFMLGARITAAMPDAGMPSSRLRRERAGDEILMLRSQH